MMSGAAHAGASIAFALFVWWFSTGLILMLVRMRRSVHAPAMAAMTVLAALCAWGLAATRGEATPVGAMAGFTYGIVIWGWLETSFLMGFVTGPRRIPLSPGLTGEGRRFVEAFATLAWHEFAILATGVALVALTSGAVNAVGTWTFVLLWVMRISAKLNLFFGAPNVSAELLPPHLDYLGSYFARRKVSAFFPVSVTLASLAFGFAVHAAVTASSDYATVATTLFATLLGLAIVEHWFLVLPLPDAALWRWAVKTPAGSGPAPMPVPVRIDRDATIAVPSRIAPVSQRVP
jgi:putative photosynthetic complex assembly protein 2